MNVLITFTKNKERIPKFKKTWDSKYFYENIYKVCFHYDMAYGDFIDLRRRTGKLLRDKAFSVAKNWKCDEYQIRLMVMRNLWFISFLIKRLWLMLLKNEVVPNKEFPEELHKPIIRKFVKRRVHSSFISSIQGADHYQAKI